MAGLSSFGEGVSCAVVGASGGIGRALVEALAGDPGVARVHALARAGAVPEGPKIAAGRIDLADEATIARAAAGIDGPLGLVIVAVGVLHDGGGLRPEKSRDALRPEALERAFRVNAIGPALAAKHFLPLLARGRKSAFAALSARVGSIGDNRLGGWHAYRASKAALNQLIRTLAIELARKNPGALCVALHPGTVDTGLSRPFQGNVPEGKLFAPGFAAGRLLAVLDELRPSDSGGFFAWDGAPIPF